MFERYDVFKKGNDPIIRKAKEGRFVLYSDVSVRYKLLKQFTINGDPKPKKNNPIPVIYKDKYHPEKQFFKHMERGFRVLILPSSIFTKYQKHALKNIPKVNVPYTQINLRVLYYRETKRRIDLVNLQEATCDILVKAGLIEDDNSQCVPSMDGSRVLYDKKHPRAEIYIERVYVEDKQTELKL